MLYFHGTSYDAGMNIIKNGFQSKQTLWNCSQKGMVYLVSEECEEYATQEGAEMFYTPAFEFAVRAGQIAAAHNNQLTDKIIVFAFEIPDDEELCPDSSAPNMDDCYQIESTRLNDWIADSSIKMTAYCLSKAYEPYLRVFYLKDLSRDYYTPSKELANVLHSLERVDTYWFYDDYIGQFSNHEIIYEANTEKQSFTY